MAYKNKTAFTLIEVLVSMVLIFAILGFVWFFYFDSRETTRHTVSQSKMQSDARIMLDHLEAEMVSCYAFDVVSPEEKRFSFYAFTPTPPHLDDVFYDTSGNYMQPGPDSKAWLSVIKLEYSFADGQVKRQITPGLLFFQRRPMQFQEGQATDSRYEKHEKIVLRDVTDFEVRPYTQLVSYSADGSCRSRSALVTGNDMSKASFITLRLHSKIDESQNKRDEELDIVTKFYSAVKLAENANPGYFCSTDSEGSY